jgi:hypothetical protein
MQARPNASQILNTCDGLPVQVVAASTPLHAHVSLLRHGMPTAVYGRSAQRMCYVAANKTGRLECSTWRDAHP